MQPDKIDARASETRRMRKPCMAIPFELGLGASHEAAMKLAYEKNATQRMRSVIWKAAAEPHGLPDGGQSNIGI